MRKIILLLDCDPGHDDAIAIILLGSSPSINLLGISVVSGNQTVEKTARNAFNVSRFVDLKVPICVGSSSPLKRKRLNCGEIHGESGLDGVTFPKYNYEYAKECVEDFIYNLAKENAPITFVATGPLTNIAKAIIKYPYINKYIEKIIIMGGSTNGGNISKYAEFNILADAEAAKIVFESGIKIRMMGLNVTRRLLALPERVDNIAKLNNRVSNLFVDLMKFFNKTQKEVFGLDGGPLHDPTTIVSLLNENVFKYDYLGELLYFFCNCFL